jgi:hypothetical protein
VLGAGEAKARGESLRDEVRRSVCGSSPEGKALAVNDGGRSAKGKCCEELWKLANAKKKRRWNRRALK